MKKIVVTGATSFLGRNMTAALLQHGYKVYALVRKNSANLALLPEHPELELVYGSLDDLDVLETSVNKADMMIHFAWDGSGDAGRAAEEIQNKNAVYSMNALKVAEKLGCTHFFFPGSQAEYGICQDKITEETECFPVSPYGKAKIAFARQAEQFCADKSIRFVHMRIFSVYGYGDRNGTLVDTCIRKLNQGQKVELGACSQLWNYLYITDFVKLVLGLMEHGCGEGIYNVAGTDTRVLREFVREIYDCSNKSGEVVFGKEIEKPEGVPVLNPDITKIIQASGYVPDTDFSQGIREIIKQSGLDS